jgi:hypothetical protein
MPSSGMLRRVVPIRLYISEECSASIIRMTTTSELGTTLAVTSNAKSHHHTSNKQALLPPLVHRYRILCDEDSLQADLVCLRDVSKQNGYSDRQIHRALNRRPHLDHPAICSTQSPSCPLPGLYPALLAECRHDTTSELRVCPVSSVLSKTTKDYGTRSRLLRPVKDYQGLRHQEPSPPSCQSLPRTTDTRSLQCGMVYIGRTGRLVDIRLQKHHQYIRLQHPEKPATDEHSIDLGHRIQFHNSSILATQTRYMDRI